VRDPKSNPPEQRTTELQSKLYQAAKREPKRRFHALEDRLSLPYVMQVAWKGVRRNQGAAGIDQQTLEQIEAQGVPEFLEVLAQRLREKPYRPQPGRRVRIPKGDGTMRPLGIPTVRDRGVQAAAKLILEPIVEADFEGTSFGFRPGVGPQEAREAVQQNARAGFRWGVDADIERFFDTRDHQQLRTARRRRISEGELLRLISRWRKAGCLLGGVYQDTDQGSPQGGVLSPLLANVYLHAFDQAPQTQKSFIGRLTRSADDFVIQCGAAEQAARAREWAREHRGRRGRTRPQQKTRVVFDREAGFDFLGFHHRRVTLARHKHESWGVLRWPSGKACRRFREQIRQLVGRPGQTQAPWGEVRRRLRAYLTGWGQYFRPGQSTRLFARLDDYGNERVARNLARSQPTGKRRRRRHGADYARWLREKNALTQLTELKHARPRPYRGRAKVRWRAGTHRRGVMRENLTHGSGRGRWKRGTLGVMERYPWAPVRKDGNRAAGCNPYHSQAPSTAPAAYSTGPPWHGSLHQSA
jgi:RNA-directed DNA polymerase